MSKYAVSSMRLGAAGGDDGDVELSSRHGGQHGRSEHTPFAHGIAPSADLPSRSGHIAVRMHMAANHDADASAAESSQSRSYSGVSPKFHRGDDADTPLTKQNTLKPSFMRRTSTLIAPPTLLGKAETDRLGDVEPPKGYYRPNSSWATAWSIGIMVAAIYNTFTVPYRMAFWEDPIHMDPDVVIMIVLDAIGDVFFFMDIYKIMRTGYPDLGTVIYEPKLIWQRYLRSWFTLDVVTCIPFDLIQLGYLRVVPAVRVVKILRLFKVLHHYNSIEERTTVSLQFRVGKLLFYTAVLSHFAACIKYHVMLRDHDDNPLYISLMAKAVFGRYLQAMYWSTGAMTGRDDTNPPENLIDAGFTVFMMVVGILWLAYIIASLETFSHDDNNSSARFQSKADYVSAFMHQFALPKEIQDKVKAYYSYLWSSSLRYDTDEFLKTLPPALQADVSLSLHRVVERADIFEGVDAGFLAYIVHTLTTTVSIPGEIVCAAGMAGLDMFFIQEGEIEILIGHKNAAIAKLRAGDHFGEYAVLASPSVRTATARSVNYCTLLVLTAENLAKGLALFPNSDMTVRAHVDEHRSKTLLQERNFLGLDSGAAGATTNGKKGRGNDKLKKLITVDEHVASKEADFWTVSPVSKFYERWQAVYFVVMLWNALVLPLRIGFFSHDSNPGILLIDYLGDAFLIADIALSFRVRFVQGGAEISDPKLIQHRYLYGWFFPHLISSLPFDFIMIHSGMYPIFRLNRILRLAHVHTEILARLKDATHYALLSLIYLVFNFLFLSHWAASIYYSFTMFEGFQQDEDGLPDYEGWRPASALENGPVVYQYLQAQYFAMALLAGIGRHLYPPTNYDVVLSLFVMLTGVFVVSYLIGKVGHLIFNLNASAAVFKAELSFVSQVMDYREVNPDVGTRVTEYLKHIWTSQKGIDPNVALRGLPRQLRTDIMMHVCEAMIRKVPKFKDLDRDFVRQLVSELEFVELPAGEFVFRQGQLGDAMFFVSNGLVEILFDTPPQPRSHGDTEPSGRPSRAMSSGADRASTPPTTHQLKCIGSGSFFGEASLLSSSGPGTRGASIRARTAVRLLRLSESSFLKVMQVHPNFAEKIMFINEERQRRMEAKMGLTPDMSPPNHRKSRVNETTTNGPHNSARRKSVMQAALPRDSPSHRGSIVSAVATAGTSNSPAMASAAATTSSSHPVTGSQWNAGNPPTLTITTTHTIALHDGHVHLPHEPPAALHQQRIISDIEINRGPVAGQPPSPNISPSAHERTLHAGVPPGFNADDELPAAAAVGSAVRRPTPDTAQPLLLNPGRGSTSAQNPPPRTSPTSPPLSASSTPPSAGLGSLASSDSLAPAGNEESPASGSASLGGIGNKNNRLAAPSR